MSKTRRRSPAVAGPSFASLDDGLLTRTLACLPFSERCRVASVCKRWARCVASPELLRTVALHLPRRPGDGVGAVLRALRSWAAFMLRHARHVRCLTLEARGAVGDEAPLLLNSALSACAASGGSDEAPALEVLDVAWESPAVPLLVTSWAAALSRLRCLKLFSGPAELRITASLAPLHALRTLRLGGWQVKLEARVGLPASLRSLALHDETSQELPQQISALSSLTALVLQGLPCPAHAYSRLTALPSLRWLDLTECLFVPACLGQLAGLQTLVIDNCFNVGGEQQLADEEVAAAAEVHHQEAAEAVAAALHHLTGLERLLLSASPAAAPPPLAALAAMGRLQHCSLGTPWQVGTGEAAASLQLEAGPWAGSLRSLGASFGTLLRSQALLHAAEQLEHLCILGAPITGGHGRVREPAEEAFWGWTRRHPSLRRLSFDMCADQAVPAPVFSRVLALQRTCPRVQVEGIGLFTSTSYYDELFELKD